MVPTSFDESNHNLSKPTEMGHDDCDALSVLITKTTTGYPVVISCWKLTKEEVDTLLKTGRLWLTVYGQTMPPVALTVEKPFQ